MKIKRVFGFLLGTVMITVMWYITALMLTPVLLGLLAEGVSPVFALAGSVAVMGPMVYLWSVIIEIPFGIVVFLMFGD